MIVSEKRLLANRRNAQRSTGPKTAEGKQISRNNALRHGLARQRASGPAHSAFREKLAIILANGENDACRELARDVAECTIELEKIRAVRFQICFDLGAFEFAEPHQHEEAMMGLQRIERYERRLFSRRRKAMQALDDASADLFERRSRLSGST
jgi:hypothetical protein